MTSVLTEIQRLRGERPMVIDYTNTNRYAVILDEPDGSKTAYYFSAPIYNIHTRKVVRPAFASYEDGACMTGSNAHITVSDCVRMENAEGYCVLRFGKELSAIHERELVYGTDIILPTTNGIVYKARCHSGGAIHFDIEASTPFVQVRDNDKHVALMSDRFRPFMVVSCIGTVDDQGGVVAPAAIAYQQLGNNRYRVTVTPVGEDGEWVMLECNMYEPKLLQDTTVESHHPQMNNAFGGTAFIGATAHCGEQWLYAKLDFSRLPEMINRRIAKVVLHSPQHNRSTVGLRAYRVAARFCSFGSNWSNKITSDDTGVDTLVVDGYQSLDITAMLTNPQMGHLVYSDGWILKPRERCAEPAVISTGDSCYAPVIIEINYK